ncbi:hypothetical protein M011DRAFT_472527 [Sporormia fimetaria CBS 119925]|uniref:Protection of telomeres protein 1 ssDNA-binding domain-containing protein n=1 Tax=Sporormia fimetaria CBS 119925 TaxID=1340428 RepID=A0A6A6UW11_9PLEO|nr:hypothetical protein M011DRAFT_472527 [Sporormia fimetaria CBS 119925]
MSRALPPGYKAIKNCCAGEVVSVIGMVTEIKPPHAFYEKQCVSFSIRDDSFDIQNDAMSIIQVDWTGNHISQLPTPGAVGDFVLLRDIKLPAELYRWKKVRVTPFYSPEGSVLFFSPDQIPMPELATEYGYGGSSKLPFKGSKNAKPPSADEQQAVIKFKATVASNPQAHQQLKQTISDKLPGMTQKWSLLQDVQAGRFCDAVVEVKKIWVNNNGETVDLVVTDYTTNPSFHPFDDQDSMPTRGSGPPDQSKMQLRLWDPHAAYVRKHPTKIYEGSVVFLSNVHIKTSANGTLEGALHQDKRFPDKVQISTVGDGIYAWQREQLEARKREFFSTKERAQNDRNAMPPPQEEPGESKGAKRKRKKKEKEQKKKEQRALEQEELERESELKEAVRAQVNPNVRAAHPEVEFSTVDDILNNPLRTLRTKDGPIEMPFVNTKYRARLRVVDFNPSNLRDFSHSMMDPRWNQNGTGRRDDRWQWGFVLLLEAADAQGPTPERFPVYVDDDAGQHLLKMNAVDLNQDKLAGGTEILRLREKLFHLWGNLLEAKQEYKPQGVEFPLPSGDPRLRNRPFDCIIEEYGSRVDPSPQHPLGWMRMYKLASTVIMD